LPGGGRTEKTAQRLLGKFSEDVFLFARGASDRKGLYYDNRKTRQGGEAASAALKSFFYSRDRIYGMAYRVNGDDVKSMGQIHQAVGWVIGVVEKEPLTRWLRDMKGRRKWNRLEDLLWR